MLYILPGMGASSAMYNEHWQALPQSVYLDWPSPPGEITFRKLAEAIIDANNITSDDTVGGSSFGGIIAVEIAKILHSKLLVLIGSAKSCDEINPILLRLAAFSDAAPITVMQFLAGKLSGHIGEMFAQSDADFIMKVCKLLPSWPGSEGVKAKIIRIHGGKDSIISRPKDGFVIPAAGHLVALTHASECVGLIRRHALAM